MNNIAESLENTEAGEVLESMGNFMQGFSWNQLLNAVLLFLACMVIIKVLMVLLGKAIERLRVERSLHTFIKSAVRIALWLIAMIVVLGYVGIPVTSLVTVLGVAGLAVSLAIQDTLSNLAGGIMLLVSKPFKVGDFIEAGGVEGTADDIGLVYTRIMTPDNKLAVVPNGEISKARITNYTVLGNRRVDLKFCVSYDEDPEKVKKCVLNVVGAHPKALFTPAPFVRVSDYKASSVEFTVRAWCVAGDYWDVYFDLMEQVKAGFDKEGITMTYEHINVHMVRE